MTDRPADPPGANPFVPEGADLAELEQASQTCQGCELFRAASHTVFGSGTCTARLMIVGEMPGDKEDISGQPFVGPAGALLEKALGQAGISRSSVYITNAVKHFKFKRRGKRRSIKSQTRVRSGHASPGLQLNLTRWNPGLFYVWARQLQKCSSEIPIVSPIIEGFCTNFRTDDRLWQSFTRPLFCACPTRSNGKLNFRALWQN